MLVLTEVPLCLQGAPALAIPPLQTQPVGASTDASSLHAADAASSGAGQPGHHMPHAQAANVRSLSWPGCWMHHMDAYIRALGVSDTPLCPVRDVGQHVACCVHVML